MKLSLLESIAIELFKQGYIYSEAYPIFRWKLNEWPILTKQEFQIVDSYIKLKKLCSDYKEE